MAERFVSTVIRTATLKHISIQEYSSNFSPALFVNEFCGIREGFNLRDLLQSLSGVIMLKVV